jgi:ATP-dependent Zn protease
MILSDWGEVNCRCESLDMTDNHLISPDSSDITNMLQRGKAVRRQKKQKNKDAGPSQYRDSKKKQGRRFFFVWLPVIVLVMLFFYVLVLDPPQPVGQPLSGTSKNSTQAQLGESSGFADVVILDDGRTVVIEGSMMGSLKAGRRVLVQENMTLIFKRKYFSFVRYIE